MSCSLCSSGGYEHATEIGWQESFGGGAMLLMFECPCGDVFSAHSLTTETRPSVGPLARHVRAKKKNPPPAEAGAG